MLAAMYPLSPRHWRSVDAHSGLSTAAAFAGGVVPVLVASLLVVGGEAHRPIVKSATSAAMAIHAQGLVLGFGFPEVFGGAASCALAIGAPHLMQAAALSLISAEHSEHLISAISLCPPIATTRFLSDEEISRRKSSCLSPERGIVIKQYQPETLGYRDDCTKCR